MVLGLCLSRVSGRACERRSRVHCEGRAEINRGFAFQALSQNGGDAMGNLDTPKAIIIAALILSLSATIVFMFRYNYAVSEVSVCFNHLTGTPTDCLMR